MCRLRTESQEASETNTMITTGSVASAKKVDHPIRSIPINTVRKLAPKAVKKKARWLSSTLAEEMGKMNK